MNENKRPQTQRSPRAQGHPQPAMPLPHQPRPTPLCTATAPDQKNRSKSNSAREEETPSRPLGGTRKSKPHERADEGRHRSKKLEQAENTEQTRETTHGRDQEQQPKKSGSESCTPQQNHSAGPGPFPKHPNCTLLWAGPGPDSYSTREERKTAAIEREKENPRPLGGARESTTHQKADTRRHNAKAETSKRQKTRQRKQHGRTQRQKQKKSGRNRSSSSTKHPRPPCRPSAQRAASVSRRPTCSLRAHLRHPHLPQSSRPPAPAQSPNEQKSPPDHTRQQPGYAKGKHTHPNAQAGRGAWRTNRQDTRTHQGAQQGDGRTDGRGGGQPGTGAPLAAKGHETDRQRATRGGALEREGRSLACFLGGRCGGASWWPVGLSVSDDQGRGALKRSGVSVATLFCALGRSRTQSVEAQRRSVGYQDLSADSI